MSDEFPDISAVKVMLADARERIKEAEDRCKEAIEKLEIRSQARMEEIERMLSALNMDLSKWNPLLTNLQKADDSKRNLMIALLVSFITNIATIALSIFVAYIKSGGSIK